MNAVWLILIVGGIAVGAANGRLDQVSSEMMESCKSAVEFVIGLTGILMLWSGLMQIASASGLTESLAKALSPIIRLLFPSIPHNHRALSYVSLAISANMLGLGNASTPLGIKAMEELQKLNKGKDTASDAMCTLLAITTSSVTLVPTTVIAMRSLTGSANPSEIIWTTLVATACSTTAALIADRFLRGRSKRTDHGKRR
jgi:spore maturation protein A